MLIWTEKYRPKHLNEVIGQEKIVKKLMTLSKSKSMPHLLFAGPAGTGKTTCALALANDIFGNNIKQNFLELNASDERGIDTIRNKVKGFARSKALGNAPFKIIFLGESDALTRDAQQALRRTMEKYSQSCRFILDCNYPNKIIDPIQSRCALFRFKPLEKSQIVEHLSNIAKKEGLEVEEGALEEIFMISNGDMRKAINILQSSSVAGRAITKEVVRDIASMARPKEIRTVLNACIKGDYIGAREMLFNTMSRYGLSAVEVIRLIQNETLNLDSISAKAKINLISKIGDYEFRIVEGSDELIQLESLLAQFFKVE